MTWNKTNTEWNNSRLSNCIITVFVNNLNELFYYFQLCLTVYYSVININPATHFQFVIDFEDASHTTQKQ